jgi:hypothetical protein
MSETIKEFKSRWSAELNAFWKKILKVSITIGGSAAGILLANSTFGLSTYVSPMVFTICGYILTFCGAIGIAAKLTKS